DALDAAGPLAGGVIGDFIQQRKRITVGQDQRDLRSRQRARRVVWNNRHGSALPALEDDRGIVAAKTERIAQRIFNLFGNALVRDVIKVAGRVRLLQVDGGRQEAFV